MRQLSDLRVVTAVLGIGSVCQCVCLSVCQQNEEQKKLAAAKKRERKKRQKEKKKAKLVNGLCTAPTAGLVDVGVVFVSGCLCM